MAKRSKSSQRWLNRQKRDYFAGAARREGRVSRAHFKLAQLDERFGLVAPDCWILELGAAPGGWTSYLAERLAQGRVVAVDPLPVAAPSARVEVVTGRFGDEAVASRIEAILGASGRSPMVDLVLSDMAPNISGVRAADQARAMDLAELVAEAADRWLAPGGALVAKLMQGEGVDAWIQAAKAAFDQVSVVKPTASRAESREVYAVAQGYRA
ncbi:MAG: RlmE family RNA methyltransferase, partial [Gammaproteobacteria bacterium]|nr:RlmE family RNA methyltransferase [Gammaproteobacteria bacterium]